MRLMNGSGGVHSSGGGGSSSSSNTAITSYSNNGNRVWIKKSAIDAVRPKHSIIRVGYVQQQRRNSENGAVAATAGAGAGAPTNVSDTESCFSTSSGGASHGRVLTWGWQQGYLIEHSNNKVVVQLLRDSSKNDKHVIDLAELDKNKDSAAARQVQLPPDCLENGDVVLCNDYEHDDDSIVMMPPHDLITLTHLHEPSVVESLQLRYTHDVIYTSTGPVLLALNPFCNIRTLYGENVMKKYWEAAEANRAGELPPHVYKIADVAFRGLRRGLEDALGITRQEPDESGGNLAASTISPVKGGGGRNNNNNSTTAVGKVNQSILVSGESGAGKTVTTKFVMKYLAALSTRNAAPKTPKRAYQVVAAQKKNPKTFPAWAATTRGKDATSTNKQAVDQSSIEHKVLQSNPILESFGNARTLRNDNSSRFGKYMELQFSRHGHLCGATMETYLLEKVRLIHQTPGERNYHVFLELLAGGGDLSRYFVAPTARPSDFKLTASGTYDRRDGVADVDTFKQLCQALSVMKIAPAEINNIWAVICCLLHASNLTFCALPPQPGGDHHATDACQLVTSNVHLTPVCHLLGVTPAALNAALCHFSIQAGRETQVQRALDLPAATKGLEALLQATFAALFEYLVARINDTIAFRRKLPVLPDNATPEEVAQHAMAVQAAEDDQPAASIGVLDIFGFESFTVNSFEQLCINYCNEALQQQFNAFVLKNEQAVYEKEGIEWSFIEFPENQNVLDLLELRHSGILSVLDDQCRTPGPSDKAFCLDVYTKCEHSDRFIASRKQKATLQFAIQHYAGPVEYTTTGFVEKNRDELPKEAAELLRSSSNPFVQHLAVILETTRELAADAGSSTGIGGASGNKIGTPGKMHRADSSVGRATVGGQFRKQLKHLRQKIDETTPHYIRCLKPNDHLVPDHFDPAIVAEQLRCGGILEAIRVARAGFTQHYPHADFVRRYRSLAWKELSKKEIRSNASPYSPRVSQQPSYIPGGRNGIAFRSQSSQSKVSPKAAEKKNEFSLLVDSKTQCKDLIRVLFRKMQQEEKQEGDGNTDAEPGHDTPPPAAKAKTYAKPTAAAAPPSWSKASSSPVKSSAPSAAPSSSPSPSRPPTHANGVKGRYTPWEKPAESKRNASIASPTPSPQSWKRGGVSSSDYAKVGIQMGKTKVFLRHKAFEALERMRSREHTKAATTLNAIFRMYLARIAYIPYRDAFRREYHSHRFGGAAGAALTDTGKESKEPDSCDVYEVARNFRKALQAHQGGSFATDSLVDKWMESQVRDAIHNPIPRHQWGQAAPTHGNFKWKLRDGLWVRNYNFQDDGGSPAPDHYNQQ